VAGAAFSVPSLAGCRSIAARRSTAQRASTGAEIDPASNRKFAAGVHGQVILPDSLDYVAARRIWNALFDKRPAMVVRCADRADVVRAVEFARTQQLLVAVRGGGHSPVGYSVCDGGIVIDLSAMKRVVVEADHGGESLDTSMYGGVRVGGHPWRPTYWRWGYGWPSPHWYTEGRGRDRSSRIHDACARCRPEAAARTRLARLARRDSGSVPSTVPTWADASAGAAAIRITRGRPSLS
jgi:hypothetical protein